MASQHCCNPRPSPSVWYISKTTTTVMTLIWAFIRVVETNLSQYIIFNGQKWPLTVIKLLWYKSNSGSQRADMALVMLVKIDIYNSKVNQSAGHGPQTGVSRHVSRLAITCGWFEPIHKSSLFHLSSYSSGNSSSKWMLRILMSLNCASHSGHSWVSALSICFRYGLCIDVTMSIQLQCNIWHYHPCNWPLLICLTFCYSTNCFLTTFVPLILFCFDGGSGGRPDEEASVRERWGHDRVNAGSPHAEKDVGRCQWFTDGSLTRFQSAVITSCQGV